MLHVVTSVKTGSQNPPTTISRYWEGGGGGVLDTSLSITDGNQQLMYIFCRYAFRINDIRIRAEYRIMTFEALF